MAYAYFDLWSDCTATTATLTTSTYSEVTPSLLIPGKKLVSGSLDVTIPAVSVTCILVEQSWEDDSYGDDSYGDDSYGDDSYPHYTSYECDYESGTPTSVEVSVDWVAKGQPYKSRESSRGKSPGGFYQYKSRGTSRDAAVTMSLKIGSNTIAATGASGSLTLSKSSEISVYTS